MYIKTTKLFKSTRGHLSYDFHALMSADEEYQPDIQIMIEMLIEKIQVVNLKDTMS